MVTAILRGADQPHTGAGWYGVQWAAMPDTHQDAFVHDAVAAVLHPDPDDTGVVNLPIVDGQGKHGDRTPVLGGVAGLASGRQNTGGQHQ